MANFWGGCTPPRHSGTCVGARVASLRCHYPPPRRSQYSRNAKARPHKSKTSCRGGHRRGTTTSGPGRSPLAGFGVTLYGRFWGDRRGNYIDQHVEDPVTKADWYSHVTSELTSKKRRISPRGFIDDYVPEEHRAPFEELLKQRRFPLKAFDLDTSDVKSRLRRLLYRTRSGAHVSVPFDKPELIQIEVERIVILDSLSSVGRQ